ncbi:NAD(P)-binding oxidoreductase [Knoellia koreensis]|uniref:SDR family oxidoreductase n=1 Tax=Knoellia koreensis TaxID=2730921 RepID=A0A849HDA8_9MICO|nr:NAD(P)-binding oxidoreductase [Knoellia sp. DB2414S]NNM45069.1 SDR family oxidoreductase [Knoellia sp. DB2414S]
MIVAIAGGHGKIAQLLERQLAEQGHEPIGLVRNADHLADLERNGARGEVVDLEHAPTEDVAAAIRGADAVVFAAGAGPGSSADRKDSMDRDGAIKLADAAEQAGIRRYVMVSAIGADDADPDSDDVFQVYLRAKADADRDVRGRVGLDWTVVRPGALTDDDGTGLVELTEEAERGSVARADVASVLAALLTTGAGVGRQVNLVGGKVPVAEAVAALG